MTGEEELRRLRRLLFSDKTRLPCGFAEALKSDLERTLSQYMRLSGRIELFIDIDDRGEYIVHISALADAVYPCKKLNG